MRGMQDIDVTFLERHFFFFWIELRFCAGLGILAGMADHGGGAFPSMGPSARQPYWEGEPCVAA